MANADELSEFEKLGAAVPKGPGLLAPGRVVSRYLVGERRLEPAKHAVEAAQRSAAMSANAAAPVAYKAFKLAGTGPVGFALKGAWNFVGFWLNSFNKAFLTASFALQEEPIRARLSQDALNALAETWNSPDVQDFRYTHLLPVSFPLRVLYAAAEYSSAKRVLSANENALRKLFGMEPRAFEVIDGRAYEKGFLQWVRSQVESPAAYQFVEDVGPAVDIPIAFMVDAVNPLWFGALKGASTAESYLRKKAIDELMSARQLTPESAVSWLTKNFGGAPVNTGRMGPVLAGFVKKGDRAAVEKLVETHGLYRRSPIDDAMDVVGWRHRGAAYAPGSSDAVYRSREDLKRLSEIEALMFSKADPLRKALRGMSLGEASEFAYMTGKYETAAEARLDYAAHKLKASPASLDAFAMWRQVTDQEIYQRFVRKNAHYERDLKIVMDALWEGVEKAHAGRDLVLEKLSKSIERAVAKEEALRKVVLETRALRELAINDSPTNRPIMQKAVEAAENRLEVAAKRTMETRDRLARTQSVFATMENAEAEAFYSAELWRKEAARTSDIAEAIPRVEHWPFEFLKEAEIPKPSGRPLKLKGTETSRVVVVDGAPVKLPRVYAEEMIRAIGKKKVRDAFMRLDPIRRVYSVEAAARARNKQELGGLWSGMGVEPIGEALPESRKLRPYKRARTLAPDPDVLATEPTKMGLEKWKANAEEIILNVARRPSKEGREEAFDELARRLKEQLEAVKAAPKEDMGGAWRKLALEKSLARLLRFAEESSAFLKKPEAENAAWQFYKGMVGSMKASMLMLPTPIPFMTINALNNTAKTVEEVGARKAFLRPNMTAFDGEDLSRYASAPQRVMWKQDVPGLGSVLDLPVVKPIFDDVVGPQMQAIEDVTRFPVFAEHYHPAYAKALSGGTSEKEAKRIGIAAGQAAVQHVQFILEEHIPALAASQYFFAPFGVFAYDSFLYEAGRVARQPRLPATLERFDEQLSKGRIGAQGKVRVGEFLVDPRGYSTYARSKDAFFKSRDLGLPEPSPQERERNTAWRMLDYVEQLGAGPLPSAAIEAMKSASKVVSDDTDGMSLKESRDAKRRFRTAFSPLDQVSKALTGEGWIEYMVRMDNELVPEAARLSTADELERGRNSVSLEYQRLGKPVRPDEAEAIYLGRRRSQVLLRNVLGLSVEVSPNPEAAAIMAERLHYRRAPVPERRRMVEELPWLRKVEGDADTPPDLHPRSEDLWKMHLLKDGESRLRLYEQADPELKRSLWDNFSGAVAGLGKSFQHEYLMAFGSGEAQAAETAPLFERAGMLEPAEKPEETLKAEAAKLEKASSKKTPKPIQGPRRLSVVDEFFATFKFRASPEKPWWEYLQPPEARGTRNSVLAIVPDHDVMRKLTPETQQKLARAQLDFQASLDTFGKDFATATSSLGEGIDGFWKKARAGEYDSLLRPAYGGKSMLELATDQALSGRQDPKTLAWTGSRIFSLGGSKVEDLRRFAVAYAADDSRSAFGTSAKMAAAETFTRELSPYFEQMMQKVEAVNRGAPVSVETVLQFADLKGQELGQRRKFGGKKVNLFLAAFDASLLNTDQGRRWTQDMVDFSVRMKAEDADRMGIESRIYPVGQSGRRDLDVRAVDLAMMGRQTSFLNVLALRPGNASLKNYLEARGTLASYEDVAYDSFEHFLSQTGTLADIVEERHPGRTPFDTVELEDSLNLGRVTAFSEGAASLALWLQERPGVLSALNRTEPKAVLAKRYPSRPAALSEILAPEPRDYVSLPGAPPAAPAPLGPLGAGIEGEADFRGQRALIDYGLYAPPSSGGYGSFAELAAGAQALTSRLNANAETEAAVIRRDRGQLDAQGKPKPGVSLYMPAKTTYWESMGAQLSYVQPLELARSASGMIGLAANLGIVDYKAARYANQVVGHAQLTDSVLQTGQGLATLFAGNSIAARQAKLTPQQNAGLSGLSAMGEITELGAGIATQSGQEELGIGLGVVGGGMKGAATGFKIGGLSGAWIGAGIGGAIGGLSQAFGARPRRRETERDIGRENAEILRQAAAAAQRQRQISTGLSRAFRDSYGPYTQRPQQLAPYQRRPQYASSTGLVRQTEASNQPRFVPRF